MSKPRLVATAMVLSAAALSAGCGESVNCWCRCPSGNSVEYSEVSSSPPTCDELCQRYDCWFEGGGECAPSERQVCDCEGGLEGERSCGADGLWGPCAGCRPPPECYEGEREACSCSTGVEGLRFCDGEVWGPCQGCEALECVPGTTRQCACPGAELGTEICGPEGEWGECLMCQAPSCTDGEQSTCACDSGATGTQRCAQGQWGPCEDCLAEGTLYGDVDFGTEGVEVGGSFREVFDTTEWGCDPMSPGEDNLIWRVFPNDGTQSETLWFEFDLPANLRSVEVTYWHMSMTSGDGSARSVPEVLINGATFDEGFLPTTGCVVSVDYAYPVEAFVSGGTNWLEVWSRDEGHGLDHGLQGVWIDYEYAE